MPKVKKLIAKRPILAPTGVRYGVGDVVPYESLNAKGIPMLIMAGHVLEVVEDIPDKIEEPTIPETELPEIQGEVPVEEKDEKPKKRSRKKTEPKIDG
jgi:hypothetical protein